MRTLFNWSFTKSKMSYLGMGLGGAAVGPEADIGLLGKGTDLVGEGVGMLSCLAAIICTLGAVEWFPVCSISFYIFENLRNTERH